jgi:CheY-like chemotaxis protein
MEKSFMVQGKQSTILLIEADASLRWLIALGLKQKEMQVVEARSPSDLPTLDTSQFHLLVLDIDDGIYSNWSLVEEARRHPIFASMPIVVLSWEPVPVSVSANGHTLHAAERGAQTIYLAKPFDARVLHDTVEQLVHAQEIQEAARVAKAEEALLASYSAHTPTSIWPIVTAAGLLLAFIGLLLNIVCVVSGIIIMLVALLLWTLGTPPTSQHQPPCVVRG